jgi:hypothetical protein
MGTIGRTVAGLLAFAFVAALTAAASADPSASPESPASAQSPAAAQAPTSVEPPASAQPPAPATPASDGQATLVLSAALNGQTTPLTGGVHWRVYSAKAEDDGSHALIVKSNLAEPTLILPPGDYVVHAAFGLASAAKRLTLGAEVHSERLTIAAGGLKIGGVLGDQPIDPSKLSLAIYVPVGRNPEGKLVYAKAKAGDVVGLPEGVYHIVSTYLDMVGGRFLASANTPSTGKSAAPAPSATVPTNSIVNADIKVTSGKLTDVTLRHRAATLTLKLVNKAGGEALANSTFTVLTPGGDVIREMVGAFPSLVLAEGEYAVIARHDGKTYQSTFQVDTGKDRDVEVVAQEPAPGAGQESGPGAGQESGPGVGQETPKDVDKEQD